jgi:Kef-type K+ transport system membrane component KefB
MDVLLLGLGTILLLALLATALAERTALPRVTLLLVLGVICGPAQMNLIPDPLVAQFGLITELTLLMVGFLIGGKLSHHSLAGRGSEVVLISVATVLGTMVTVTLGLAAAGLGWPMAIALGCIAAATDPTAVLDVVNQFVTADGPRRRCGDLLLGITALDDVWALLLFGLGLSLATAIQGDGDAPLAALLWACRDLGGGVLVGLLVGLPAVLLTGRIREGQPMLVEALGIVLLCGGLALHFAVSYVVAAMVMGTVVSNLASHHDFPFHAIEGIELPFMAVFFVLAGASLDLGSLGRIGAIGLAYVLLRAAGKVWGAAAGAGLARSDSPTRRWVGAALLPQAGVAVGMALVAAEQLQDADGLVLSIAIGSTVVFELIGPSFVRLTLSRFRSGPDLALPAP